MKNYNIKTKHSYLCNVSNMLWNIYELVCNLLNRNKRNVSRETSVD